MFILGVDVGIKEVDIPCQFSMVKGLYTVNVAWEEQANGPEGAYCRVVVTGESVFIRVVCSGLAQAAAEICRSFNYHSCETP